MNSIILNEPESKGGVEEIEVVETKMILVDKIVATKIREAKKAEEARATKDAKRLKLLLRPRGDSIWEIVALVIAEINAAVETISASPVPIAAPKKWFAYILFHLFLPHVIGCGLILWKWKCFFILDDLVLNLELSG